MADLLPLFLNIAERDVVLVGGGRVAAWKLRQLLAAGARVRVVAPDVSAQIAQAEVSLSRRAFVPDDLNGAWLAVAAATPEVNRQVAAAAEARHVFVNAVDDPPNASAFLGGVVRRDGVTIAVSTSGVAPALTSLLRQALDAVLPRNLGAWLDEARRQRAIWRRDQVPMAERTPRLLRALNNLHGRSEDLHYDCHRTDLHYDRHRTDLHYDCHKADLHDDRHRTDAAENPGAGVGEADVVQDFSPALMVVAQDVSPARPAVPAPSARRAYAGHVSLVGAGPGDPGLLTRSAIARLRSADLVLYDALIDDRILRYARKAQRFFVGKRAGRRAMSDEAVHGVMIRAARLGRRIVRLKGGDPFVFGRGGEEALALGRAGVPYDVVPGVTSAIAAPALAGIPVTYRGVSSAFCVVSGHSEQSFAAAVGSLRPAGITLVVLMGLGRAAALADILLSRGWPAGMPAAIIVGASQPGQQVWRGSLADLAAGEGHQGSQARGWLGTDTQGPGTIVIGDVVAIAESAQVGAERKYVNSR